MPPTRRKPSNPTTSASQKTLSFNSRSNKVTKPSIPASSKPLSDKSITKPQTASLRKAVAADDDAPPPALSEEVDAQIEEEPTAADLAIRQQVEEVKKKTEGEVKKGGSEEEKAGKVGEAQIKKYWRGKEEERKAPRGGFRLYFGSHRDKIPWEGKRGVGRC